MSVHVKLYFFAKAREIIGKKEDNIQLPDVITYDELLNTIAKKFELSEIKNNVILALNEEYCNSNELICLKSGDEIAVIPPLSGVASPTCGAVSIFVGTTRDNFDGKTVLHLEYEAFEQMAVKELQRICLDIRTKWPNVENIAVYHRLGTVPVKEASVVIAISSPHRADAIFATQWCIDNVKSSVPIWKKEIYADGAPEWKENKESHPPKTLKFKLGIKQDVELPSVSTHLVQIKASNQEIEDRINKFIERKRNEINKCNIRDFCRKGKDVDDANSCARIDSVLIKRKDSKGHLQVNRVYNNYSCRDQNGTEYLSMHIPKNGIEERLQNVESQLNLKMPVPKDIYDRLKDLEDRLLYLESISPEYIQFWDKDIVLHKSHKRKKIFSLDEIDSLILDLEITKSSHKG